MPVVRGEENVPGIEAKLGQRQKALPEVPPRCPLAEDRPHHMADPGEGLFRARPSWRSRRPAA
jgi:hypothetical protein